MKKEINTSKGKYEYYLKPVYNGVKRIDKLQARENLLLFNDICKKNRLRFCLGYGTLLGAVRDHDFINHDEDIDLLILKDDIELFKSMLFELRENGFEVIRCDRRFFLCSLMRNGEYIDIYGFNKTDYGPWKCLSYYIPDRYMSDWKYLEFLGEQFFVPSQTEETLVFLYGKNWKIPIQTFNYEMNWFQKKMQLIKWYLYFYMPNFIFQSIIKHRLKKKIEAYNCSVTDVNSFYGQEILKKIEY